MFLIIIVTAELEEKDKENQEKLDEIRERYK
jgi:hypothetical protein